MSSWRFLAALLAVCIASSSAFAQSREIATFGHAAPESKVSTSNRLVDLTQGRGTPETARAHLKSWLGVAARRPGTIGLDTLLEHLFGRAASGAQSDQVGLDFGAPVGDLDGDHRNDLVRLSYRLRRGEFTHDGRLTIQALRGRNGASLWRRGFVIDEGLAIPHVARVGEGGRAGLIIQNFGFVVANGRFALRIELVGLTGEGKIAWRHTFAPDSSTSLGVVVGVPGNPRLFNGVVGPATDVLIGLTTMRGTTIGVVHVLLAETRAVIVDGSNGELLEDPTPETNFSLSPYPAPLEYVGEWVPDPLPAPDVSRDGAHDHVYVMARAGRESRVSLRRSDDGEELWSSEEIPIGIFNEVAWKADLNADDTTDLLFATRLRDGSELTSPALLTAVSGADGSVLWSGAGRNVRVLGDIDGDGVDDVGTSDSFYSDESAGIHYYGFSGLDGDVLYHAPYTLRYLGGSANLVTFYGPAGDLDADSAPDFFFDVGLGQEGLPPQRKSRMVSGRTGKAIRGGSPWYPLEISLDGHGDDVGRTMLLGGERLVVTTSTEDPSDLLWNAEYDLQARIISEAGIFATTSLFGGRFSSDGCSDLGFSLLGSKASFLVVLNGHDGSLLWSRRLTGKGGDSFGKLVAQSGRTGC